MFDPKLQEHHTAVRKQIQDFKRPDNKSVALETITQKMWMCQKHRRDRAGKSSEAAGAK